MLHKTDPLRVSFGRTLVLCAERWGGAGNRLWAENVADSLAAVVPSVDVRSVDQAGTYFGDKASELHTLKLVASSASVRRTAYERWAAQIFEELAALWEAIEPSEQSLDQRVCADLLPLLTYSRYETVIATKGVLAQAAAWTMSRHRLPRANVFSFVTNPGLLEMRMHRATRVAAFAIPRKGWAEPSQLSGLERPVITLPIERREKSGGTETLNGFELGRHTLIIIANEDGHPWMPFLDHALRAIPRLQVIFIGVRNEALVGEAQRVLASSSSPAFVAVSWLNPASLGRTLATMPGAVVVTKPGPSTVARIAEIGAYAVLWDAGLPPEDWVLRSARGHLPIVESLEEAVHATVAAFSISHNLAPWQLRYLPRGAL